MNQTQGIYSATVTPQSLVVGATTSYLFQISSPFILLYGDILYVQFPTQLSSTLASTYQSCQGESYLSQTITCSLSGTYGLYINVSMNGNGINQIPAQQVFSFMINGVQNPASTKPTSLFTVEVFDYKMGLVNSMNPSLTSFITTMTIPGAFQSISVSHQSQIAYQSTSYVFTIVLSQMLPANGIIVITYPSQVTIDYSNFGCSLDIQSSFPSCSYSYNQNNYNITMNSVTNLIIASGTTITVTINGLINSKYAAATNTFQVFTYTYDGYAIDQVLTGLTITNQCNYPCLTCVTGEPSVCLTCQPSSSFAILYDGQCVSACPFGFYMSSDLCYPCDSACTYCLGSATNCMACQSDYFFLNNQCLSSCPSVGYFENTQSGNCELCDSPCYTCYASASSCTSCLQNITQNLFFNGGCYEQCPAQISVNQNGVCVPCSQNCQTCNNLDSVCSSCYSPAKLDYLSMSCVDVCPMGTTVDQGTICALCNSSCNTCASTSTNYCLTCQYGLYLDEVTNQCVTSCSEGTAALILSNSQSSGSQEQVCQACSPGCLSCEKGINYCTQCDDSLDYLFFNFTCVHGSCPTNYTRLNSTLNVCIRSGLVCAYGYGFNDYGQCVLDSAVCKRGYVLNSNGSECIPKPVFYFPFLFTLLAIAWTILVLIRRRKAVPQPNQVTVITQLIIGYVVIQTISYWIMFGLSFAIQYRFIISLHCISIVALFLTNVIGALYFDLKITKEDPAFKYWIEENEKGIRIYAWTAGIVSFKLLRGLYCKANIRGRKAIFDAAFTDRYEALVFPLFVLTIVNLIIQVIPVLIDDVYTIVFIPWGYQIIHMSIDNFILAVLILTLEVIEFRIHKRIYLEQGGRGEKSHLVDYKNVKDADQSNVMGALQDDESQEGLQAFRNNLSHHNKIHQSIDLISQSDSYLCETKPQKNKVTRQAQGDTTEAKLLENLVRKIGQEFKFNELQNYYNNACNQNEVMDEELSLRTSNKNNLYPLSNQGKKYAVEQLRGRIENKLLGRPPTYDQKEPPSLEEQFNEMDLGVRKIITDKGIELESARTQKYTYYPQGAQAQKQEENNEREEFKKDVNEYNKFFDEIKADLDHNFLERNNFEEREWHSFDEDVMRDFHGDMEPESDFEKGDTSSCLSFPMRSNNVKLQDPQYLARLELYREKIKSKHQFNNLYAERADDRRRKQDFLFATRRTQTYEKEVCIGDTDIFDKFEQYGQGQYEEDQVMELEAGIAGKLISHMINAISSDDLNSNIEDYSLDSDDSHKLRHGYGGNKRRRELQFDLDEVLGVFDIDDFGNIIMNEENMRDNFNRKVNKHGYLIDHYRNIINQEGMVIFEVEELDSDEDLPQPFKFDQRKKQLLKQEERFTVKPEDQRLSAREEDTLLNLEDEKIEEELQMLKNVSKPSSLDSQMGYSPDRDGDENGDQYNSAGSNNMSGGKRRKKGNSKDLMLAKAYGGSPPKPKKKVIKKLPKTNKGALERQPTDRLFPNFIQEEERLRKLQNLTESRGIGKEEDGENQDKQVRASREVSPSPNQVNLEKYLKQQLGQINQFRNQDREERKQQQQQQQVQQEDETEGDADDGENEITEDHREEAKRGGVLSQDSATTTRSISRTMLGLNSTQNDDGGVMDPLQQMAWFDSKSLQNQYLPKHQYQQNNTNSSFMNKSNNVQPVVSHQQPYYSQMPQQVQYTQQQQQRINTAQQQNNYNNQQQQQNSFQDQNSNMNASYSNPTQEDLSPMGGNNVPVSSTFQPPPVGRLEDKKTNFAFYLPIDKKKVMLKSKYNKTDIKRKDSQLSNAGQLNIYGDSKLKDLEGIYLKKYGAGRPETQMTGGNRGGGIMGGVQQTRALSQARNADQMPLSVQIGAKFRPLQHNVFEGTDTNQDDFGLNTGDNEDYETVFGGMKKAMSKIEEIRYQERLRGGGAPRTLNGNFLQQDKGRLGVQNNNWV